MVLKFLSDDRLRRRMPGTECLGGDCQEGYQETGDREKGCDL